MLRTLQVLPVGDSCFCFQFFILVCTNLLFQSWALDISRWSGIACHWENSPRLFSAQPLPIKWSHRGDFTCSGSRQDCGDCWLAFEELTWYVQICWHGRDASVFVKDTICGAQGSWEWQKALNPASLCGCTPQESLHSWLGPGGWIQCWRTLFSEQGRVSDFSILCFGSNWNRDQGLMSTNYFH